jgi:hypothetical protein
VPGFQSSLGLRGYRGRRPTGCRSSSCSSGPWNGTSTGRSSASAWFCWNGLAAGAHAGRRRPRTDPGALQAAADRRLRLRSAGDPDPGGDPQLAAWSRSYRGYSRSTSYLRTPAAGQVLLLRSARTSDDLPEASASGPPAPHSGRVASRATLAQAAGPSAGPPRFSACATSASCRVRRLRAQARVTWSDSFDSPSGIRRRGPTSSMLDGPSYVPSRAGRPFVP